MATYSIKKDPCSGDTDMVTITVEGVDYQFNAGALKDGNQDWFGDVLSHQMQEVHDRAVRKTKREIKEIRQLANNKSLKGKLKTLKKLLRIRIASIRYYLKRIKLLKIA